MLEYALGSVAGLRLTARPSAVLWSAALWALAAGLLTAWGLPLATAVALGLIVSAMHTASEIFHQLGHAWAARRTMT